MGRHPIQAPADRADPAALIARAGDIAAESAVLLDAWMKASKAGRPAPVIGRKLRATKRKLAEILAAIADPVRNTCVGQSPMQMPSPTPSATP